MLHEIKDACFARILTILTNERLHEYGVSKEQIFRNRNKNNISDLGSNSQLFTLTVLLLSLRLMVTNQSLEIQETKMRRSGWSVVVNEILLIKFYQHGRHDVTCKS